MRYQFIIALLICLIASSCTSKKEILYLQDIDQFNNAAINYQEVKIQPNDILKINVGALIPETAIPYNRVTNQVQQVNSLELLRLEGYLVSDKGTIVFPGLETISVVNKTTAELEAFIRDELINGGHLSAPTVNVRIVNAKVTLLGEVNNPGTFFISEENLTVFQALGLAGDLTINGKRDDVLIIREEDGIRKVTHIDLTSADWIDGPNYFVKPNDVIVVNQNEPKVKSAGFIGNVGTLLGVSSVLLSVIILVTR